MLVPKSHPTCCPISYHIMLWPTKFRHLFPTLQWPPAVFWQRKSVSSLHSIEQSPPQPFISFQWKENHWVKSSEKPTVLTIRLHILYHNSYLSLCLYIQLVWTQNQNTLKSLKLRKTVVTWKVISAWLKPGQFLSLDFRFLKNKMGHCTRINYPFKDFVNTLML